MTLPFDLNILDLALLVIMALFMVRGFLRGFVAELAGLAGIVGGLWLAGRYHAELGRLLLPYIKDPVWAGMVAFAVILCVTLLGVSAVVGIMHKFLALTFTAWLNHLAGGVVGLLKGVVICAIAVGLMQYFLADAPFMATSKVRPHIARFSSVLVDMLPLNISQLEMRSLS